MVKFGREVGVLEEIGVEIFYGELPGTRCWVPGGWVATMFHVEHLGESRDGWGSGVLWLV